MKLSLLVLATTAATVLAAPAEKPAEIAHLAREAAEDLIVATSDDVLSATATPADNYEYGDNAEEKRDLAVGEMHELAKRWFLDPGWISCGGQWWEYGKKRVAIQYTGITDTPWALQGLIMSGGSDLSIDNFQGWWRTDKNVWEINWGFPDHETARQIETWKRNYGITCRW